MPNEPVRQGAMPWLPLKLAPMGQGPKPGAEQFILHTELADTLHGGGEPAVGGIGLTLLERAVERGLGWRHCSSLKRGRPRWRGGGWGGYEWEKGGDGKGGGLRCRRHI